MANKQNEDIKKATDRMKSGTGFVKQYIDKSLDAEETADLPSVINGPMDDVNLERLKKRLKNNKEVDDDD